MDGTPDIGRPLGIPLRSEARRGSHSHFYDPILLRCNGTLNLLRGWLLLPLARQRPTEPVPIHLPHPQRQRWQVVGELHPNHRRVHGDCSDCAHRCPLPEKEQDCSSLAYSSSHHHLALQRLPKAKALLRHNAPTDQDLCSGRQGERGRWQYPRLPLREGKVSPAIDT